MTVSAFQTPVAKWIRHLSTNQVIHGSSPGRIVKVTAFLQELITLIGILIKFLSLFHRPCGLMDKASDIESENSSFES